MREAVFAIGNRPSAQRLSEFVLQTYHRQVSAGLIEQGVRSFALPLNQAQLAAVIGVTSVHLNRTLRVLRSAGHLKLRKGLVEILDLHGLELEALN